MAATISSAGGILAVAAAVIVLLTLTMGGYTAWWLRYRRPPVSRTAAEAAEARSRIRQAAVQQRGSLLRRFVIRGGPGILVVFFVAIGLFGPRRWWVALLFALGAVVIGVLGPLVMIRWVISGDRRPE